MRNIGSNRKRRIRRALLRRDGRACAYCGIEVVDVSQDMLGECLPDNILTIDHVIPVSKGGTWMLENLVLCCLGCNQWKGQR